MLHSLSPNLDTLVAFRAIQPLSTAFSFSTSLSIISNASPGQRDRTSAIGTWATVPGTSTATGPVVGGLLDDDVGWRSAFSVSSSSA